MEKTIILNEQQLEFLKEILEGFEQDYYSQKYQAIALQILDKIEE